MLVPVTTTQQHSSTTMPGEKGPARKYAWSTNRRKVTKMKESEKEEMRAKYRSIKQFFGSGDNKVIQVCAFNNVCVTRNVLGMDESGRSVSGDVLMHNNNNACSQRRWDSLTGSQVATI